MDVGGRKGGGGREGDPGREEGREGGTKLVVGGGGWDEYRREEGREREKERARARARE